MTLNNHTITQQTHTKNNNPTPAPQSVVSQPAVSLAFLALGHGGATRIKDKQRVNISNFLQ